MRRFVAVFCACIAFGRGLPAAARQYPWERLPPTPTLPKPERNGTATGNGIRLWYAVFGHGGIANPDDWGLLHFLGQR